VPWQCLSRDTDHTYVDSKSLPDAMTLVDPSKLRVVGISDIWDHWARRQAEKSQGLVFLKAQGGDMREKVQFVKKKKQNEKHDDVNKERARDKGEGSSKDADKPHPESPDAHSLTLEERMAFLRGLSKNAVYSKFLKALEGKLHNVRISAFLMHFPLMYHVTMQDQHKQLEHIPDWCVWRLRTKYLPAAFHHKKSIRQLMLLAREDWHSMDEIAQFVVLCMGLALRDICAIHFVESPSEYPADMPEWVKASPWTIDDMHNVMELWGMQLQGAPHDNAPAHGRNMGDNGGKGRKPAGSDKGKRKAAELAPDADGDEASL
jgi:hypothetical protein